MKKHIMTLFITALLLANTLAVNALAVTPAPGYLAVPQDDAVVYAEQTKWVYRDNNGVIEKRCWSITYQRWLTDWMPV